MVAGRDFGDFIVWRRDDVPAYQLAVVVDDAAMRVSEVVRGADLLKSPHGKFFCVVRSGFRFPTIITAISSATTQESGWPSDTMRSAFNNSAKTDGRLSRCGPGRGFDSFDGLNNEGLMRRRLAVPASSGCGYKERRKFNKSC